MPAYFHEWWCPWGHGSCVANFAQVVVQGELPLSVERLGGQGVEQFGRSEALVSLFDHQLPFLDPLISDSRVVDLRMV